MDARTRWLIAVVVMIASLGIAGCGSDGGGDETIATGRAPVSLDSSVPPSISSSITAVHGPTSTVSPGGTVELNPDGSFPVLVATGRDGTPYLLAIGSHDGALGVSSTSESLVLAGLDVLPEAPNLTVDQIRQVIHGSPNYDSLSISVRTALESNRSPLLDEDVARKTWSVVQNVVAALGNSTLIATAHETVTPVSPPTPFFLINNSEPYAKVWLDDVPGTNAVRVNNQTFVAWSLTTNLTNGDRINATTAPPLRTTSLQLVAYYGGSATTVEINGAEPEFGLNLAQTPATRSQNGIAAFVKYYLFIISAAAGLYPKKEMTDCVSTVLKSVFNDRFPLFATQPDAASAIDYFSKVLPEKSEVYPKLSACGLLPTVSDVFGAAIGRIWRALNLTRSLVNTVGTVGQTFYYWNFDQSFQICKSGGRISSCNAALEIINASCTKVDDGGYVRAGTIVGPTYSYSAQVRATSMNQGESVSVDAKVPTDLNTTTITCSSGWDGSRTDIISGLWCTRNGTNPTVNISYSGVVTYLPGAVPGAITSITATLLGSNYQVATKPLLCP